MNLLSSLKYLVALHEHRHFGRAAAACHITQPALSNALRALEDEFKVVIVKRDRAFVGFTPEGERVLASARVMLHEHEVLAQELSSQAHAPRGSLHMGAVPTAMPILARFAALLQARHPGITPVVLSMSSQELEQRLQELSLDLALGYTDRMAQGDQPGVRLVALPQYTEHYFLLQRATTPSPTGLQTGAPLRWADAAQSPLCLLTPNMHNRTVVDAAFVASGVVVQPVLQTNSILTMVLAVLAGEVSSVLPGSLVDVARSYGELQARPLIEPEVRTPMGFMFHAAARPSRALDVALSFAQDGAWLRHAGMHSDLLQAV